MLIYGPFGFNFFLFGSRKNSEYIGSLNSTETILPHTGNIASILKYCQNEQNYLYLVTFIFTKLSQIMHLINTHILAHRYDWCDCRLQKVLWCKYVFLGIFKYYYMFVALYLHETFTNRMLIMIIAYHPAICNYMLEKSDMYRDEK